MLLGAAMLLARRRNQLRGTVKFLFQPAEEEGGRGGALPMIEAGVMNDPKVDYVFGLHVFSNFPSGVFALRAGALMAAPDHFKIVVTGKGGHGSEPHKTIDPIFVSAQLIVALQGIRSRIIDQTEPFVLTVASFHSGTKNNIIPSEAVLEGTIRTLDEETRTRAKELVESMTSSICSTFGASARTEFKQNAYPVTVNDVAVATEVFEILREIGSTVECEAVLGGEDFSRFLQQAPGAYYFLGTYNESKGCVHPNHSSKFDTDEDVLVNGSVSLAELALRFTEKQ
jgi:carboxypeptidase Ss1